MTTDHQQRVRGMRLKKFMENEWHYIGHDENLDMTELSPYHFRFEDMKRRIKIDIYPSTRKYHILKSPKRKKDGLRGEYRDLEELIKEVKNN